MFAYVEAAGCTNACRHCSAEGHPPHGAFFSSAELSALVADGWQFCLYYEATAHPEFPDIARPEFFGGGGGYFSTNGFGIARAADPEVVFARLRERGWRDLSLTVHGLRDHHDWFVARKGAYDELIRATVLARQNGFGLHWNITLDNRSLPELPQLIALAEDTIGGPGYLDVIRHHPNRRLWRFEELRVSLRDVRERLAPRIVEEVWRTASGEPAEPEKLTEAYWMAEWDRAANSGEGPERFGVGTETDPQVKITRQRQVYLCTPHVPAYVGELSEGREALERRAVEMCARPVCPTPPPEADVLRDSDLLHPGGMSVRHKAISLQLQAQRNAAG